MEMFELELIICIKMDLALNNQQRLICHKTQPTNQQSIRLPAIRAQVTNYTYSLCLGFKVLADTFHMSKTEDFYINMVKMKMNLLNQIKIRRFYTDKSECS